MSCHILHKRNKSWSQTDFHKSIAFWAQVSIVISGWMSYFVCASNLWPILYFLWLFSSLEEHIHLITLPNYSILCTWACMMQSITSATWFGVYEGLTKTWNEKRHISHNNNSHSWNNTTLDYAISFNTATCSDLKLSENLDRHVWNMTWTDITTTRWQV